jgi:DNA modification methylase
MFVWAKTNPTPSFRKVSWVSATEFVWVGSKGESKVKNFLTQKEMYNYALTPNKSSYGKTEHPTEKPESVIARFVKASSLEGDIVLDPFVGSGTTAVVSKKLSRSYIGIELNPKYIEIANKRINETRIVDDLFSASQNG